MNCKSMCRHWKRVLHVESVLFDEGFLLVDVERSVGAVILLDLARMLRAVAPDGDAFTLPPRPAPAAVAAATAAVASPQRSAPQLSLARSRSVVVDEDEDGEEASTACDGRTASRARLPARYGSTFIQSGYTYGGECETVTR